MRADFWLLAFLGLANASTLVSRDGGPPGPGPNPPPPNTTGVSAASVDSSDDGHSDDENSDDSKNGSWRPKTNHPEFFSLRVDEDCAHHSSDCQFNNYAIRLDKGMAIATPYNKWWDPALPIFFVDDDTQLYTVSKKPLQLYVDDVTGALRYTPVGWLPPNAIAISFYKLGNNPLGIVGPSPAQLSWPVTQGLMDRETKPWWFCPLGGTGQYQVFVSSDNFGPTGPSGVAMDLGACQKKDLAAINADPWHKGAHQPW